MSNDDASHAADLPHPTREQHRPPTLTDYRVLFAYVNAQGQERYEFTTVLATDEENAVEQLANVHALDYGYQVVQVVESNGTHTGFTEDDHLAAVNEAAERRKAGVDA